MLGKEVVSLSDMTSPQELPQLVTELVEMSKQYLRQETLGPARRLGKAAGFGLGAGVAFAFGALFLGLGVYAALRVLLPEGDWWLVLARGLTALAAAGAAAVVVGRMTR